ncbi:hypothetical protein [Methylocystis bryophila]|uniref:Uncharacterized protein n=1 Tax=Methylocystis bryophila TaxID=655015 RepID=A0A1W6MRA4_9HYPH|nr:hypothetical protein [Methylocystis bryophila]ARN80107.1 hypothetical protein B1812_02330 [Methylocystis bryophila]BDV40040.1 hypothetical protein DSM21852_32930 [Methylocystis bryophila]
MRRALVVFLPLLAVSTRAEAAPVTLTCSLGQEGMPKQELVLEIEDGGVRLGSDHENIVDAQSLEKRSLVIKKDLISFRQMFAATRVAWDWKIDRATGKVTQKYINTETGKPFLTKTGDCTGG